jgi:uncharacterized protein YciI
MQYILIARDHSSALKLRLSVRENHISNSNILRDRGILKSAIGLLDENNDLHGSVMVFEVESREELDALLEKEIYYTAGVWDKDQIEIIPCKIGPSFEKE